MVHEGFRLWKGSPEEQKEEENHSLSSADPYSEDPLAEVSEKLPPRPIYIKVDARNNPVMEEVTGVVEAIHMLPYHTNVFLGNRKTLEFKTKSFPRSISSGDTISVLGTPIYVEGNPVGFLFVNCKLT